MAKVEERVKMAKITISTKDAVRCSKKGCSYRGPLDRHHLRHELMFVKVFAWRSDRLYRKLVKRYEEFRAEDIRYLCRGHHGEIHEIYDDIITTDQATAGKRVMGYNWRQARKLMARLRKAYFAWVRVKTKQSNPTSDRLPREGEKARLIQ